MPMLLNDFKLNVGMLFGVNGEDLLNKVHNPKHQVTVALVGKYIDFTRCLPFSDRSITGWWLCQFLQR